MYYQKEVKHVLKELESSENGLSEKEAKKRLEKYGRNVIERKYKIHPIQIFFKQFLDPLVIILIIATVITFIFKEFLDSIVILAILLLNAILGFVQEYRAEKSIELLRKLNTPSSKVIRDGKIKTISSELLVPGDVIVFETGDKINVDARLINLHNLKNDESILTGESTPVNKQISKIKNKVIVSDQNNMVFSGTLVVAGNGKAVVTETGSYTEIGKIARLVEQVDAGETPLQKKLKILSHNLGILAIVIAGLVFFLGFVKDFDLLEMFKAGISLAIAIIPEGLPAVVTFSLALGVQRMLKKKSLIRKLHAVETLGSTTIIATDKTGTLTKNEMTVTDLFVNDQDIKITGQGYKTEGNFLFNNKKVDIRRLNNIFNIAAGCNNASLPNIGDPTELALLVMAKKGRVNKIEGRISEEEFTSEKKYMSVSYESVKYLKGAPEKILKFCNYIEINGIIKKLNGKDKEELLDKNFEMTSKALRVLGLAYEKNQKTVFVGLAGMIDPPREEVKDAIKIAKEAGIRVIMITGDHKNTAVAVAKKIGITGEAISGEDLDKYAVEDYIDHVNIYARVSPEHKVVILEALQKKKEIVAMTGDGINDAPALKKADIGIAMNIKGTDVARDASDMILVDDNFVSIVDAVHEGRVIYDNIKKFVKYLLSANVGEVGIILIGLLFGMPLPLLPLQILWVNLVTDGLPALALGLDPADSNVMKRKPREKKEHILKNNWSFVFLAGIVGTVIVLYLFNRNLVFGVDKARTIALTTLILFELFLVFTVRSEELVLGLESNKYLWGAVFLSVVLHLIVMYSGLNVAFKLVPLNFNEWISIILFSSVGFWFFEIRKIVRSFFKSKV